MRKLIKPFLLSSYLWTLSLGLSPSSEAQHFDCQASHLGSKGTKDFIAEFRPYLNRFEEEFSRYNTQYKTNDQLSISAGVLEKAIDVYLRFYKTYCDWPQSAPKLEIQEFLRMNAYIGAESRNRLIKGHIPQDKIAFWEDRVQTYIRNFWWFKEIHEKHYPDIVEARDVQGLTKICPAPCSSYLSGMARPTPVPATPSQTPKDTPVGRVSNSLGMEFVYIPPGTFLMGSPSNEAGRSDNEPQHRVTLSQGYYLQTTEVTQGQWQAVMGTSVREQRDKADKNWSLAGEGADYPMYYVSWEEVQEFIRRMNNRGEGSYRLPTEAEWEYAARSGSSSAYSFGNTAQQLEQYGNFADRSIIGKWNEKVDSWADGNSNDGYITAAPVGSLKPNGWGLYDMHGNVWEWVQDWYGSYPTGSVTDPQGAGSGSYRVLRGGSWYFYAQYARSAFRGYMGPGTRDEAHGFRLVRGQ